MVEDVRELVARRSDVLTLVAHRPRVTDVDATPRQDVDLAAVRDGADPGRVRRVEQDVDDLGHIRLARAVRMWAVWVDGLRGARSRRPVLAVDDRPQPKRVRWLLAHEPHARAAHPMRCRRLRAVVVGEAGSEGVRAMHTAVDVRRAEVAACASRARWRHALARLWRACILPEQVRYTREVGAGHGRTVSRPSCARTSIIALGRSRRDPRVSMPPAPR